MTDQSHSPYALRVNDLVEDQPTKFHIVLETKELETMRDCLDLLELRKARLTGTIAPSGKKDWVVKAELGATVVQPCVATLEPVVTRIDLNVERRFVAEFVSPDEDEVEMPEDDSIEPLGSHIDPLQILEESLSLALPLYPRASGVDDVSLQVTEPGKEALTDESAKPFAGLAALKDKLSGEES